MPVPGRAFLAPRRAFHQHVLLTPILGLVLWLTIPLAAAAPSGAASDFQLALDTYKAGESPAIEAAFDFAAGELEPYRVELRLPPGFRFEGFGAAGPAEGSIGAYGLDGDFDGVPDRTVHLRARSDFTAYADVIPDGRYSAGIEPLLEAKPDGFVLTLPGGGDMDPSTLTVPLDARAGLSLVSGVIVNAREAGDYTFVATVTSVDPDTGGPDDFQGSEPVTLALSEPVVVEPAEVEFDELVVRRAKVTLAKTGKNGFKIDGWFVLGAESDGIDPPSEVVEIVFGPFSTTLAPGSFHLDDDQYKYESDKPGLYQVKIKADGAFQMKAKGVDLDGIDPNGPVPFALRIGDDIGETEIFVRRRNRSGFHGDSGWPRP